MNIIEAAKQKLISDNKDRQKKHADELNVISRRNRLLETAKAQILIMLVSQLHEKTHFSVEATTNNQNSCIARITNHDPASCRSSCLVGEVHVAWQQYDVKKYRGGDYEKADHLVAKLIRFEKSPSLASASAFSSAPNYDDLHLERPIKSDTTLMAEFVESFAKSLVNPISVFIKS